MLAAVLCAVPMVGGLMDAFVENLGRCGLLPDPGWNDGRLLV
ncbi:MAG: hypothetical protein WA397_03280 [Roseiarcus sp.]